MNRERDRNGRFIAVRQGLEDTLNIMSIAVRLMPIIMVLLFVMNYFRAWKSFSNYGSLLWNIGNPDCNLVCLSSEVE